MRRETGRQQAIRGILMSKLLTVETGADSCKGVLEDCVELASRSYQWKHNEVREFIKQLPSMILLAIPFRNICPSVFKIIFSNLIPYLTNCPSSRAASLPGHAHSLPSLHSSSITNILVIHTSHYFQGADSSSSLHADIST